eukprot:scaffold20973_cov53-Phaeocystis_antarctica.AAC.16
MHGVMHGASMPAESAASSACSAVRCLTRPLRRQPRMGRSESPTTPAMSHVVVAAVVVRTGEAHGECGAVRCGAVRCGAVRCGWRGRRRCRTACRVE